MMSRRLNIFSSHSNRNGQHNPAGVCVFLAAGITWGKVVSMYAVAGALAVDCVRHGHPSTVHIIVDSLGQFVRKFLVSWLKRRGGWVSAAPE